MPEMTDTEILNWIAENCTIEVNEWGSSWSKDEPGDLRSFINSQAKTPDENGCAGSKPTCTRRNRGYKPMPQIDYRTEHPDYLHYQDWLSAIGSEGWQLCAISADDIHVFSKPRCPIASGLRKEPHEIAAIRNKKPNPNITFG